MHLTPSVSGYFENIWLWVADQYVVLYCCSYTRLNLLASDVDDADWKDDNNEMVTGLPRNFVS
jgi:hypothetical protein